MVKVTPPTERNIETPKPGTYIARLYQIFHMGTHKGMFGPQTQCQFRFELCSQKADFGNGKQPFSVTAYGNPSFSSRSQLTRMMKNLGINTDEAYDIEDSLGRACQITVSNRVVDGNTYLTAKMVDVAPLGEGQTAPELQNAKRFFWISADYTYEDKVDEKGNPVLDEKGKTESEKSGAYNVSLYGLTDDPMGELTEKQLDKVLNSREYHALIKESEEKADGSLPF